MNPRTLLSSEFIRVAFQRFPESLSCALLGTLVTFGLIAHVINHDDGPVDRLLYLCSIGFFWFLALRFFVEARGDDVKKGRLAGLVLFLVFSILILGIRTATGEMLSFIGGLTLLMFAAPYLRHGVMNSDFWGFCHELGRGLFFAIVLGGVFLLGVFLIVLSLDDLFGINLEDRVMLYVWAATHGFVCPAYFLARAPHSFTYPIDCELPRDVRIISSYLCIPFVWCYLLILYAYMAKIALLGDLPKGQLGWIISVFGVAGIVTHLVAYPMRETGSRLAQSYYRWFYPALLLPIGLLALALYSRIAPYGLTESRYLMVLLCLWFAIVALYFTWKREQAQLKIVPAVLAVLLLAVSFGPGSIANLPIRSQFSRLTGLLEANGMLENGKLVAAKGEVSRKVRREITGAFDYLNDRNRDSARKRLASLLPQDSELVTRLRSREIYREPEGPSSVREAFFAVADIKPLSRWEYRAGRGHEGESSYDLNCAPGEVFDVRDYDSMVSLALYGTDSKEFTHEGRRYVIRLAEKLSLQIEEKDNPSKNYLLPISEPLKKRISGMDAPYNSKELAPQELLFTGPEGSLRLTFQATNLYASKENDDAPLLINNVTGFLLIGRKP